MLASEVEAVDAARIRQRFKSTQSAETLAAAEKWLATGQSHAAHNGWESAAWKAVGLPITRCNKWPHLPVWLVQPTSRRI